MEKQGINQRCRMLKNDVMTLGSLGFNFTKLLPILTNVVNGGSLLQRNFCDFRGAVDPKWNADSSNAACDVHL